MTKKSKLGQFYTTNYKYILQRLSIPSNIKNIIEPFAGKKDLLKKFNTVDRKLTIKYYDIDPKEKDIIKKDTLLTPPNYENKFIITNPPYLARNKSKDKTLFNKYGVNDLYKCFIKNILTNQCLGGIVIVPLNFWCSIRKMDIELRKQFLDVYNVLKINIFEERVFDDTSYTVCSFQFEKKKNIQKKISIVIYPDKFKIKASLTSKNNYLIGGDIYNLECNTDYKITRLTSKNKHETKYHTNILVKCIDDNKKNQIGLRYVSNKDKFIDETPKLSSRTYATLHISPHLSKVKQQKLVKDFNIYLTNHRKRYNSLFLTNYRESKDISRKRISFNLVYRIAKKILN